MSTSRVTLADVARAAGVSLSSVSNVIHGHPHVREAVRIRVNEAIDQVGYRPLAIGRNLKSGRTGQVLLAIPNFAQPYFAELARDAVAAAASYGMTLTVQQTDNDVDRELAVADSWNLGAADGLIFSPSSISDEDIESRRRGMPVVLLGEHSHLDTVDRVAINSVELGRIATEHLIAQGCRTIAMVGHKDTGDPHVVSERQEGYRLALAAHGLEPVAAIGSVTDWTRRDGQEATRSLLDRFPGIDGLVCANDLLALGAMRELRTRGIPIGPGVAVVGIDDIEEAAYAEPGLTTVAIDRTAMIEDAFELMRARIDDPARAPQVRTAAHTLIVRESTRRA